MSTRPWRSLLRPLSTPVAAPVLIGALVLAGAPLAPRAGERPGLPAAEKLLRSTQQVRIFVKASAGATYKP